MVVVFKLPSPLDSRLADKSCTTGPSGRRRRHWYCVFYVDGEGESDVGKYSGKKDERDSSYLKRV